MVSQEKGFCVNLPEESMKLLHFLRRKSTFFSNMTRLNITSSCAKQHLINFYLLKKSNFSLLLRRQSNAFGQNQYTQLSFWFILEF